MGHILYTKIFGLTSTFIIKRQNPDLTNIMYIFVAMATHNSLENRTQGAEIFCSKSGRTCLKYAKLTEKGVFPTIMSILQDPHETGVVKNAQFSTRFSMNFFTKCNFLRRFDFGEACTGALARRYMRC
jgi:hypothetical protein